MYWPTIGIGMPDGAPGHPGARAPLPPERRNGTLWLLIFRKISRLS
jgi:hypothetical protein